jgi:hypothetical protein
VTIVNDSATVVVIVLLIIAGAVFLGIRSPFGPQSGVAPSPPRRAFRNPSNGYEEEVGTAWVGCLFLGCIYFAARGIWTHAVAAALLAIFTGGVSWVIYPFFARQIVETHYLRRGWLPV